MMLALLFSVFAIADASYRCTLTKDAYRANRAKSFAMKSQCFQKGNSKSQCQAQKSSYSNGKQMCEWDNRRAGRSEAEAEEFACYANSDQNKEECEAATEQEDCEGMEKGCWWRPKIVDPSSVSAPCTGVITGLNVKCAKAKDEEACGKVKSLFGKRYCKWEGAAARGVETDFAVVSGPIMGVALVMGVFAALVFACVRKGKTVKMAPGQQYVQIA